MRLARSPGNQLRMTDLAAQTSLSTSGVTRVVDRMERDGLLRRRACPTDRRSSYAVVTAAGLHRLDETLPGHLQIIEQWFTGQLDPAAAGGPARRAAPGPRRGAPGRHRRQHRAGRRLRRTDGHPRPDQYPARAAPAERPAELPRQAGR